MYDIVPRSYQHATGFVDGLVIDLHASRSNQGIGLSSRMRRLEDLIESNTCTNATTSRFFFSALIILQECVAAADLI